MSSTRSFFLVALLSTFLVTGCGKKMWPTPVTDEEMFTFQETSAWLAESCLQVRTRIAGNTNNLDHLVLQLEYGQCPSCPFQPQDEQVFFLSAPGLKKENNQITLTLCPKTKMPDRIRLVGYNRYRQLAPHVSQVLTITQGKEHASL